MVATQLGINFIIIILFTLVSVSITAWIAIIFAKKLHSLVKYSKIWETWNSILWSWVLFLLGGVGLGGSLLALYLLDLIGKPLSFIQVFLVMLPLFLGFVMGILVADIYVKKFYNDVVEVVKKMELAEEKEL